MLLRSVPELELAEPAEQAICCGSAGIYNLVQPKAARESATARRPTCSPPAQTPTHCQPWLSRQVARRSAAPNVLCPALHPVELLDASIRGVETDELLAGSRR